MAARKMANDPGVEVVERPGQEAPMQRAGWPGLWMLHLHHVDVVGSFCR